jgi:hypothetical protein
MDDERFIKDFEAAKFPPRKWHHKEHIKAAYLYLMQYPFDEALHRVRIGIKALNAAQQVHETVKRGYHETMTQAWLRLVHLVLRQYGPARNADTFYEEHPELSQNKVLRLFYSPRRLMTPKAKAQFVEPDLVALPRSSPPRKPKRAARRKRRPR